jgi:hypothetical protein
MSSTLRSNPVLGRVRALRAISDIGRLVMVLALPGR